MSVVVGLVVQGGKPEKPVRKLFMLRSAKCRSVGLCREMLLNEASVLGVGESESWRASLSGRLWVREDAGGRWEARWAELRGNLLHLWVKRGLPGAGAWLVVAEDCVVEPAEEEEGRETAFRLRFLSSGAALPLAAETQDEMQLWVTALASASTKHARLTLAALQEKLQPPAPVIPEETSTEPTTSSS